MKSPGIEEISKRTTRAGLTSLEFNALEALSDAYRAFQAVVGEGRTRNADLTEVTLHIHGLQNMILAQVAARVYPDEFRLMGESFQEG